MNKKPIKPLNVKPKLDKSDKDTLLFDLRIGLSRKNTDFIKDESERLKLKPNDLINKWIDYLANQKQGTRIFYLFPELVDALEDEINEKIQTQAEKLYQDRIENNLENHTKTTPKTKS